MFSLCVASDVRIDQEIFTVTFGVGGGGVLWPKYGNLGHKRGGTSCVHEISSVVGV